MKSTDSVSRWLAYILLILILCIIIYNSYNTNNTNITNNTNNTNITDYSVNSSSLVIEQFKNETLKDELEDDVNLVYLEKIMQKQVDSVLNNKKVYELPSISFIYSGYSEIYDYIISKAIYVLLHELENKDKRKPTTLFSFESIPRLYVYIIESQPTKIHIVFSNLKKDVNLINLFNDTLKQDNVINTQTKIVEKGETDSNMRTSIANINDLDIIKKLIIKHNLTNVNYDLMDYKDEINKLILLLSNINGNLLYNYIFNRDDNRILNIRYNINENEDIVKTLRYDNKYIKLNTNTNNASRFKYKFSNVLLGSSNFIFDKDKQDFLFHQDELVMRNNIINYLFRNNNLGIFISLDRIDKLILNTLNSNMYEMYYKITNKPGELSAKEILTKLDTRLTLEMDRKALALYEQQYKQTNSNSNSNDKLSDITPDTNMFEKLNIKPNITFYMLHNKFQIIKIIIRPYEKDMLL